MNRSFLVILVVLALPLSSCTQYATISPSRPRFRPVRAVVGAMLSVDQRLTAAHEREKSAPLVALGEFLSVAEIAERQLRANSGDHEARDAYNYAVARVLGTLKQAKADPWSRPLRVAAASGEFVLAHHPDPRPEWNPVLYDFTPADEFDVKGAYVSERVKKEGIGAPVVAIGREANKNISKTASLPRTFYGVTAVIRFEGRRAEIAFEDPLATEHVTLHGHDFPLAADFTVPMAVMLQSLDPKKLELTRLLQPEKYAHTARIARLQPYDPDKTVVLVIHGLMDSPATWAPMINHLRGDEQIRRNYQFWFYSYPSGYPYPYAASILRGELDAVEQRFPLRKKIVVIGHSMGGCISRLLLTDTGDRLWMAIFKKAPADVHLSPEHRKLFTKALIFRHRPEIGRVIFISAPLRGSELASSWAGRIGSMFVRAPHALLEAGAGAFRLTSFQTDELKLKRIPNSVDTLAPNNRFVKTIQTIPMVPHIPYHVICGDRGKGGNKDKTPPVMSDGIVPYWSSHLEGAQSELVVPSSHSAHQNAQAIEEVQRILKLHVGQ